MKFIILSAALFAVASAFPSSTHLPGGRHSIDVNSPELVDALEHIQDDLNARLNSTYYHKIVKIIAAQSQVVAGVLYHVDFEFAQTQCLRSKVTKETRAQCTESSHVQICHARILSQPWLHLVRTEEFHCLLKQNAGGLQPVDVHSPRLMEALNHVEEDLNGRLNNSQYYHKVGKVLSAQAQVVSGLLFHVQFEFDTTKCLKSEVISKKMARAQCTELTGVQICSAKILTQPWIHYIHAEEFHCTPKTVAESESEVQVGGRHKLDVHDVHLMELVIEAEAKINGQINSLYYHKITKILSAESQVVSGIMYYIEFEFAATQCLKEKVTKQNRAMCDASSSVQLCQVTIHSQSWKHVFDVTSLKCTAKTF